MLIATRRFNDCGVLYEVGDVVDVSADRGEELKRQSLVEEQKRPAPVKGAKGKSSEPSGDGKPLTEGNQEPGIETAG